MSAYYYPLPRHPSADGASMTNRETYRTLIEHVINHQPGLCALLRDMDRLHGFNISVLVLGESGTGKEVIARALHECDAMRWSIRGHQLRCPAGATAGG